MFRARDLAPSGVSTAYLTRTVGYPKMERFGVSFTLVPTARPALEKIYFFLLAAPGKKLLALSLLPNGGVEAEAFINPTYPAPNTYPSESIYPMDTMDAFPSASYYPSADVFPSTPNPIRKGVISNSAESLRVEVYLEDPLTRAGQVEIYVDRIGTRSMGSAFFGPLDWYSSPVSTMSIGAITSLVPENAYDFYFKDLSIEGNIVSADWFDARGFDGFELDNFSESKKWQGAVDVGDESSYSDPTDIRNLARYNYVRPYSEDFLWGQEATFGDLASEDFVRDFEDISWGSHRTFDQTGDVNHETTELGFPKGLVWGVPASAPGGTRWGDRRTFRQLRDSDFSI